MLLSGNFQSEYIAAVERVQTTILLEHKNLILCRRVLLPGNFQSVHVAAVESVQTTILSEP